MVKTGDGSYTIYVPDLDEHYHSKHGAVTESEHIFIRSAFLFHQSYNPLILEFGMGTGLNVILTFKYATATGKSVHYHAIEKYPVTPQEAVQLDLPGIPDDREGAITRKIHMSKWGERILLRDDFSLFKEQADFRQADPKGKFDIIYYDAFAPDVQPGLWSVEMFKKIYSIASPGAVLTTYSAKGIVRRNLAAAGFRVEKLPGPPGKREITRALKPVAENPVTWSAGG